MKIEFESKYNKGDIVFFKPINANEIKLGIILECNVKINNDGYKIYYSILRLDNKCVVIEENSIIVELNIDMIDSLKNKYKEYEETKAKNEILNNNTSS